jgi:hypothetical protein
MSSSPQEVRKGSACCLIEGFCPKAKGDQPRKDRCDRVVLKWNDDVRSSYYMDRATEFEFQDLPREFRY